MQQSISSNLMIIIYILLIIVLSSCGSLNPTNDFFGIQMNPSEEESFKLISYSESDGIKYTSSPSMNPEISAWAEFDANEIVIDIVNNSQRNIQLNSFNDQFVLITDQEKYNLSEVNADVYLPETTITPNTSHELRVKLPSEYGQDITKRTGALLKKDIMGDISKNWSINDVIKGNTKFILLKVDDIVILLKKVPEE